jgi:hypothetical protein
MNEIRNVLNNKLIVGGIFCDLEKAFSCVNHDILLAKLETYEITGKDKELHPSHLKDRYQRVLICNKSHHYSNLSNWTLIKHGSPAGFHPGSHDISFINKWFTSLCK